MRTPAVSASTLLRSLGLRVGAARRGLANPSTLKQRTWPVSRQISLMPWRQAAAGSGLPTYFPKPKVDPALRRRAWLNTIGRITFSILVTYACYEVFMTLVVDPFLDWNESEWENLSEKERQAILDAEDADPPMIFLPFPFSLKEVKQAPYKGNDPEWKTFIAISKDPKQQKAIKGELANIVRASVEKHPVLRPGLGSNVKVTKYWLDFIYPQRPPPKHFVSGVFIDDEGIGWTDRPIDSSAAQRITQVFGPAAISSFVLSYGRATLEGAAQEAQRWLGFAEPPAAQSTTHPFSSILNENMKPVGPPRPPVLQAPQGGDPDAPTLGDPELQKRLQARQAVASQVAWGEFQKNWKPVKKWPTRGCVVVDGTLEIKGDRAVMAVLVVGFYDPKAKKFVNLDARVKHIRALKQNPLPR